MKNIIKYGFTQSPLVSCSPIITSHQSKACNKVANQADFLMVDRAFKALQNDIKISTKKPWPRILRPKDTGRNRGFGRYLVYFDFKN
jgi:hypothetical protein